jgi:hypothetical protein
VISLRHLPLGVLLVSCSVYSESMLDAGGSMITSGGSSSPAGAGRSSTAADGGRAAVGGSKGSPVAQAGDATDEPMNGGAGNAAGGTGVLSGGGGGGGVIATAGTTGVAGGAQVGGMSGGGMPNPPTIVDVVDDMEDGNSYLLNKAPRYGFWYVAGDPTVGATMTKIADIVATLAPARGTSTSSVHFAASGYTTWGATVGLSFADKAGNLGKRAPYDAGNSVGISFWVRGSITDNQKLHVLFPIVDTDPTGKLCGGTNQGQCLDHFTTTVPVTSQWQQVSIYFSALHQSGWGAPATSASFDQAQMLGLEFTALTYNADLWIDDLALMRP